MSIPVRCPGCGNVLNIADSHAGKRGKCPKCGASVQVPRSAGIGGSSSKLPQAERSSSSVLRLAAGVTPIPKRTAEAEKRSKPPAWAWIVPCVGIVVVLFVFLALWAYFKHASATMPVRNAPTPTHLASADAGMLRQCPTNS